MTKIGLISDIHGGLQDLQSALRLLAQVPVDHILCAGDLVDYGAQSNAVVQRIFQAAIPCVQGNHDRDARYNQRLRVRQHQQTDQPIDLLTSDTLDLLDTLPLTRRFTWEATTVFLAHATPWDNDMYIYPDCTPHLLRRVVRDAAADVVILGHTHQPMWIVIDDTTLINPGSLSQNYTLPTGTYGVLTLPERRMQLFNVQTGEALPLERDMR